MADEGYEDVGPGTPVNSQPKNANPAFPEASDGNKDSKPNAGGIPQFPEAASTGAPQKVSQIDNKKAVSMVDKSSVKADAKSKVSKDASAVSKPSKKSVYAKGNSSTMEKQGGKEEASKVTERPNGLDTCQLAFVLFSMIIVLIVSIPVLLVATGNADIEFIQEQFEQEL